MGGKIQDALTGQKSYFGIGPSTGAKINVQLAKEAAAVSAANAATRRETDAYLDNFKSFYDELGKLGTGPGGGGGGGKAKDAAKELAEATDDIQESVSKLKEAWGDASRDIARNLGNLEFAHKEKMRGLQDENQKVESSLKKLAREYARTVDEINKQELKLAQQEAKLNKSANKIGQSEDDLVADQVRKIAELQDKMNRFGLDPSALSADQVTNVLQNRSNPSSFSLSAADIRNFNLTGEGESQVNTALELLKEQEALKQYVDSKVAVSQSLKDELQAGSTTFSAVLQKIVEAQKNLQEAQTRTGATAFEKGLVGIGEQREGLDEQRDSLQEQRDGLKERRADEKNKRDDRIRELNDEKSALQKKAQEEIASYQVQRGELLRVQQAVRGFHDDYITKLDGMKVKNTEMAESVKKMVDDLEIQLGRLTKIQLDAQAAQARLAKESSQTSSRRQERATERAVGGYSSGLTLVGERGPELLDLPGGSYVHSNRQTQGMFGGVTIQGPLVGTVQVTNEADEDRLIQKLARVIQLRTLNA